MKPENHFIDKLKEIVFQNCTDEQFGVKQLAQQFGISRSQLHRKLKSATGQSISQFIRETRLDEAFKLLQNHDFTASEVSYKVGFNSPSYFNTCFHEYFGYPPGELRHQVELEKANNHGQAYGVKREQWTTRKRKFLLFLLIIIGLLSIAGVLLNEKSSIIPEDTTDMTFKSVAVMPFKDVNPSADHAWLASGLVDKINDNLIKIKGLRVITNPSVTYLEKTNTSIENIVEKLELTHYLEGSVFRYEDKIRISVKLISSDDFSVQWSQTFDQNISSIFDIMDEVATSVGRELHYEFNPAEVRIPLAERTTSPEAYELYQKARYEITKVIGEVHPIAREYLEQAIKLDPSFYAAYVELGYYWSSQYVWDGHMSSNFREDIKRANKLYEYVIEKDPNYGRPYSLLAHNKIWYDQAFEAYALQKKGFRINPSEYAPINTLLPALGNNPEKHYELALDAIKKSPYEPWSWTGKGLAEYFMGKYDDAINTFEEALDRFANGSVNGTAIRVFYALGKYEKVIKTSEDYFIQVPGSRPSRILGYLAAAHYKQGNFKEYEFLLEELRKQAAASPIGSPSFHLAMVNAQTGNYDTAFKWLDKAVKDKEVELYWLNVEPPFKSLSEDPRWEKLLNEIGFNDLTKTS